VEVSPRGVELAAVITAKAVAVLTLVLVLWATAPWEVTLKAAHALRVPGLVVQLVALTYRYLLLLGEEVGRLRIALRVRRCRRPHGPPPAQLPARGPRRRPPAGALRGGGRARRPGDALPRVRRPLPLPGGLPDRARRRARLRPGRGLGRRAARLGPAALKGSA